MKNLWCHMNSISSASFCLYLTMKIQTERSRRYLLEKETINKNFLLQLLKLKLFFFFLLKLN